MVSSIAKISRPHLPKVYLRERLFAHLDSVAEKPLVWLTAPGGSGKTTLVTSWLDSRKRPSLWFQVDEGDIDLAAFFYYLGEAAKPFIPRQKKTLPLLTPEYLQGLAVFTRRYFEKLFSLLPPASAVVFDNYQDVPDGFGFHEMMANALESIPGGRQVIIISRSEPPPQLSRFLANNRLHLLSWDDVRFTLPESREFLCGYAGEPISDSVLEQYHTKSDGWAAGLVLLTARSRFAKDAAATAPLLTPREVFEYFAHEIFIKTDQAVQEVLLQTAFLRKVDPALAEQLTGIGAIDQMLETLRRNNFFTQKYDQDYQYHPLFREFLQTLAKERFSRDKITSIRHRAALLLAEAGQVEEAAELYLDAGDWEAVTALIVARAPGLVAQGRRRTLAGWMDRLPEEIAEASPWLIYWKGISLMHLDPYDARNCMARAFEQFKQQDDLVGILNAWAIISDSIMYGWGELREPWIRAFDEIIAAHPVFPSRELEVRCTVSMFNMLMLWTTLREDLPVWEAKATAIAAQCQHPLLYMQVNHALMIYHLWLGSFNKAGLILRALGRPESAPDEEPLAHLLWYDCHAMYAWVAADHEACFEAVRNGLALSERTGVHVMDPYLNKYGVSAAVSLGYPAFARELIDKYATRPRLNTMTRSFYYYLSSLTAWGEGDTRRAIEDAKQTLDLLKDLDARVGAYCTYVLLAVACYDQGDHEEAAFHLNKSLERCVEGSYLQFITLFFMGRAALDAGDEQEATRLLRISLAVGVRQGFMNFAYWHNPTMAHLCGFALEQGIEVDYVRKLILLHRMTPSGRALECPDWPWTVKIYTLGRFELLVNGVPGGKPDSATASKPLQLLKAVIARGGADVSQEEVADLLWPDADGDQARRSFDTTMHRLRKMLGHEQALSIRNGKLNLDPALVWLDARLFEAYFDRLSPVAKDSIRSEQIPLYEKAIALYKGSFLPAEKSESWTLDRRDRLRGRFVRLVTALGGFWEQQQKYEQALECYRRSLEVDTPAEELCRHLMSCLMTLGRHAEALAVFEQCRRNLLATLGVEPSPATLTLVNTIRTACR